VLGPALSSLPPNSATGRARFGRIPDSNSVPARARGSRERFVLGLCPSFSATDFIDRIYKHAHRALVPSTLRSTTARNRSVERESLPPWGKSEFGRRRGLQALLGCFPCLAYLFPSLVILIAAVSLASVLGVLRSSVHQWCGLLVLPHRAVGGPRRSILVVSPSSPCARTASLPGSMLRWPLHPSGARTPPPWALSCCLCASPRVGDGGCVVGLRVSDGVRPLRR
jgi:hypothetical protein